MGYTKDVQESKIYLIEKYIQPGMVMCSDAFRDLLGIVKWQQETIYRLNLRVGLLENFGQPISIKKSHTKLRRKGVR